MVYFQTKIRNFGQILEGLRLENVNEFGWPFGIFFMAIWFIVCSFGTVFPVLVSFTKKNLATLVSGPTRLLSEPPLFENCFPRITFVRKLILFF
jgi:hypothetical protein